MDATTRIFEAGDVIFREGEEGREMFILLEGQVDLRVKVDKGEAVIKTVFTPNDFFGEMALIDERPRSATARAEKRTKVLVVDGPSFEALILQNGKFALKIIKVLSARLRSSNERVSDLIETMPRERLARGLADYAFRFGETIHDGSYKVGIEHLKAWINQHLGFPQDEIDSGIQRFIKGEVISYAPTSAKTHEALVLPLAFMKENDRRGLAPE
jgi:CRP-like cAMP-binding protein